MTYHIHPDTRLGYVQLTVSHLSRAVTFYQQSLGFQLHRQQGNMAYLGAGAADLVVLVENPQAPTARGTTGLYHFAILVPSRLELAQVLKRIAETKTRVQGFSDHWVSEAIYLADPDGNGIEVYCDRPRSEWRYKEGQLQMVTEPLNIEGLMVELAKPRAEWTGLDIATVLGHMHLHVAHLNQAQAFYGGVLGFDLVTQMHHALFMSAGGYHHHLGLNTWAGVGAPPPPPNAIGLQHFAIYLPDEAALNQVLARVRQAHLTLTETASGYFLQDPSRNGLILAVA